MLLWWKDTKNNHILYMCLGNLWQALLWNLHIHEKSPDTGNIRAGPGPYVLLWTNPSSSGEEGGWRPRGEMKEAAHIHTLNRCWCYTHTEMHVYMTIKSKMNPLFVFKINIKYGKLKHNHNTDERCNCEVTGRSSKNRIRWQQSFPILWLRQKIFWAVLAWSKTAARWFTV